MNSTNNTVTKVNTNSNNAEEDNVLKLSENDHQMLIVKLEVL